MIYIGIVGTRRRDAREDLEVVLCAFQDITQRCILSIANFTIVSGGCKQGGDRFAEIIIDRFKTQKIIHLPDKSQLDKELLKKNPRAAYAKINYARNTLIARDARDYLIACVAEDRKGGTEDTIKKFKKLNPETWQDKLILV